MAMKMKSDWIAKMVATRLGRLGWEFRSSKLHR